MMGGSASVPGSNDLLTLLQVLADPDAAKETIKTLVEATDKANAAAQRAVDAQAQATREMNERVAELLATQAECERRSTVADAKEQAANETMAVLNGEYRAEGKKLKEYRLSLEQLEANLKSREFESSKALQAREAAITTSETNTRVLALKAQADADAAATAKSLYEAKLEDIHNQLKKLSL